MSSPPPVTQFAQDVYNRLEPIWAGDGQRGYPLLAFIGGLGEAFRQGEEAARARPGRQPYQQCWDINACPDWLLPFLGQAVGVTVTLSQTPDQQRAQIIAEQGYARGRPANLIGRVEQTMTQPGRVHLIERDPDAWGIAVRYDPAYTLDATATQNAITAGTVAALAVNAVSSSVPIIDEGTRTIDAAAGVINTVTLADIT